MYHIARWESVNSEMPFTEIESCDDANFVVTGGTGGCHYDNLQFHQ